MPPRKTIRGQVCPAIPAELGNICRSERQVLPVCALNRHTECPHCGMRLIGKKSASHCYGYAFRQSVSRPDGCDRMHKTVTLSTGAHRISIGESGSFRTCTEICQEANEGTGARTLVDSTEYAMLLEALYYLKFRVRRVSDLCAARDGSRPTLPAGTPSSAGPADVASGNHSDCTIGRRRRHVTPERMLDRCPGSPACC